jgi:hypothetical protein
VKPPTQGKVARRDEGNRCSDQLAVPNHQSTLVPVTQHVEVLDLRLDALDQPFEAVDPDLSAQSVPEASGLLR